MRTLPAWALALALCVLGPGTSGCRRATNSPEYAEAQGLHDRLVMDQGDDAYLSTEMDRVEQLLAQVPDNSLDKDAAAALRTKVQQERERVRAEQEAADEPMADPGSPSFDTGASPSATMESGPAAVDAGAPRPVPGMTVDEFRRLFGNCFDPGQDLLIAGVGVRQTYELRNMPACQTQHADYANLVVVIDNNVIAGFAQKQAMRLSLPDGGTPSEQPEAAPAPAQPAPQQPAQPAAPPPAEDPSQLTVPPPPPQDQSGRDYEGIKY